MRKINLDLGKISKGMRLKFSLILDSFNPQNKSLDLLNHYHIDGNDYIKISPHPFITIDISDSYDKNESWNANKSVNLNYLSKMILENKLNIIIHNFQIKNLFYYDKDKLLVNQDIIKRLNYQPFMLGNKTCIFRYGVIPDEKNNETEYEGVIFMINSPDNFCYLTVEEVTFLQYMLKSIDMVGLSIQVLTYYNSIKNDIEEEIIDIKAPIVQESNEEYNSVVIPQLKQEDTIPNL